MQATPKYATQKMRVATRALPTAGNRDGSRDSSFDGKRDVNLDVLQPPDVPVDTAPILGTCAAPIEIPSDVSHVDLSVNTASALHLVDFPCVSNGGDIVFKIESNQPEMAYADTFGTAWNTALFFTDTCDSVNPPEGTDMVTCSDDACGTTQSQAFAKLSYGYHYLIVSGPNGEGGDVIVHFQRAPIGNGPLVPLPWVREVSSEPPMAWTAPAPAIPPAPRTATGGRIAPRTLEVVSCLHVQGRRLGYGSDSANPSHGLPVVQRRRCGLWHAIDRRHRDLARRGIVRSHRGRHLVAKLRGLHPNLHAPLTDPDWP
jgi:hypothetical protein